MYFPRLFASIGIALLVSGAGAWADLALPAQTPYRFLTEDLAARQSRVCLALTATPKDETEKTTESANQATTPDNASDAQEERQILLLAGGLLTGFALERTVDERVGEGSGAANLQESMYRAMLAGTGLAYLFGKSGTKRKYGTACEAVIESGLMTSGIKYLAGRQRPVTANGDPSAWEGPGSGYQSFVSGHTSSAFAIATVLTKERPKRKWLYYGLATLVGVSRIQKRAHFLSDVCGGAIVGVYAGRRAVGHETWARKLNVFKR